MRAPSQLAGTQTEGADNDSALPTAPQQPFHGTRGAAPGPRGCWAIASHGSPCAAARRADSDFCNAHSGIGVAANPKGFAAKGLEQSRINRRRRADLRLALGITRKDSPRSALKAAVGLSKERLAWRAVDAALDPSMPSEKAVPAVLSLINEVDPQAELTLSTADSSAIHSLSLDEALALARAEGLPTDGSIEPCVDIGPSRASESPNGLSAPESTAP
jgi:hypothetical protein